MPVELVEPLVPLVVVELRWTPVLPVPPVLATLPPIEPFEPVWPPVVLLVGAVVGPQPTNPNNATDANVATPEGTTRFMFIPPCLLARLPVVAGNGLLSGVGR
jgi:hypothetical protein